MPATTVDRATPYRKDLTRYNLPVLTNTAIIAGSLVGLNASGFVVPAVVSTTLRILGMALESRPANAGASGTQRCPIRPGIHCWANSPDADLIALTNVGADCFAVDNQTVALTSGGATRSLAGVIVDVDQWGVWVDTRYHLDSAAAADINVTQRGRATLVAGSVVVGTTIVLTANSRIQVSLSARPTVTTNFVSVAVVARTTGIAGVGAFTIEALITSGAIDSDAVATVDWLIID